MSLDLSRTRRQLLAWGIGAALGSVPAASRARDASHAPPAAATPTPARSGVHGMVLFGGREGLYGSHLPMFHAPHDVQAVMRLRAVDPVHERRLRASLASEPALWTLEPEPFDLNRLDPASPATTPARTRFAARVVEGHFERGGIERWATVQFEVERVLLFKTLDPTQRQASRRDFLWIGDGMEHFLVKQLDQRPDIDLIGRFGLAEPRHAGAPLTLPGSPLAAPEMADLQRVLVRAGVRPAGEVKWLYAETDDLR